jgi:mannitol-1-/sugar-/sorbitol-6-phosphatase
MDLSALTGRVFAAVLFDLDGTLIDSTPAVRRSWERWAAEFGVTLPSTGQWRWHGVPAAQIVPLLLPPEQVTEGVRRIEEIETADTDGVIVLPGTLDALKSIGERAAIATSCTRLLAEARIAAAGFPVPAVVVTADRTERGKPDPAPYLLAARELGVDPADSLVVEDAAAGLVAGRAAGAATLALTTTTPPEELAADAVVGTLADVRFVVDDNGIRVVPT